MTATRDATAARVRRTRQGVVVAAFAAALGAATTIGLHTAASGTAAQTGNQSSGARHSTSHAQQAGKRHRQRLARIRRQQSRTAATQQPAKPAPAPVTPPTNTQSHATTSGS